MSAKLLHTRHCTSEQSIVSGLQYSPTAPTQTNLSLAPSASTSANGPIFSLARPSFLLPHQRPRLPPTSPVTGTPIRAVPVHLLRHYHYVLRPLTHRLVRLSRAGCQSTGSSQSGFHGGSGSHSSSTTGGSTANSSGGAASKSTTASGGSKGGINKAATDNRANQLNPNNQSVQDNRANQVNPNNAATKRGGSS